MTIPSTSRSSPTTGTARRWCRLASSSSSRTGVSGETRYTRGLITSRTSSRGWMVSSRISAIASTSSGERAAARRVDGLLLAERPGQRGHRLQVQVVGGGRGEHQHHHLRPALPLPDGERARGATPSATTSRSTASVRRCGRRTRSPTWMTSRMRFSANSPSSRSGRGTSPVSRSRAARAAIAAWTVSTSSGASTCSGRRTSVSRSSRPPLPGSLREPPG